MINETRTNSNTLEIRGGGDQLSIEGYAIVFNSESQNLGGFVEVISERALDGVDMSDVYIYSQHKSEDILGNTQSGTLQLRLTEKGLYFSVELPNTSLGKDTYELVKRGDLKSLSFGFIVEEDTWNTTVSPQIRTINKIKQLEEISVVSRPAYTDTVVSTRAKEMTARCTKLQGCFNEPTKENKYLDEANAIINTIIN